MKKFSQIVEAINVDFLKVNPGQDTEQLIKDVTLSLDMCSYIECKGSSISWIQKTWDKNYFKFIPSAYQIRFGPLPKKKKVNTGYVFTLDEINSYWQEILDILNTLDSYGLNCGIVNYAPNCVEMTLYVEEK